MSKSHDMLKNKNIENNFCYLKFAEIANFKNES